MLTIEAKRRNGERETNEKQWTKFNKETILNMDKDNRYYPQTEMKQINHRQQHHIPIVSVSSSIGLKK